MTPSFSVLDHLHMANALRLAERAAYTTRPNPMVGCVIAHGERVVGQGWHQRAGGPHAEVFALREAGSEARGATAYVTLEPCAHYGRTPPCALALIEAGVSRVVAAMRDPFPKVDGGGFDLLRNAGIEVAEGLMAAQARELNKGFLSRVERNRPWLRVKLAASLDGRTAMADGSSKWITGPAAREDVQHWRARAGAILTGADTVLADDPMLTVRLANTEVMPPLRVVLDSRLRSLECSRVREGGAPTLYLHAAAVSAPDAADAEFASVPSVDGRLIRVQCWRCWPSGASTRCIPKPARHWPVRCCVLAGWTNCCCIRRPRCWATTDARCWLASASRRWTSSVACAWSTSGRWARTPGCCCAREGLTQSRRYAIGVRSLRRPLRQRGIGLSTAASTAHAGRGSTRPMPRPAAASPSTAAGAG